MLIFVYVLLLVAAISLVVAVSVERRPPVRETLTPAEWEALKQLNREIPIPFEPPPSYEDKVFSTLPLQMALKMADPDHPYVEGPEFVPTDTWVRAMKNTGSV